MSAHNDIVALQRRIDRLTRAAGRVRAQLADLHSVAYEPAVHDDQPTHTPGFESRPPPGASRDFPDIGTKPPARLTRSDQAHHLWRRCEAQIVMIEDIAVGLERAVTGWFMVSAVIEPSRGSLISAEEHQRKLDRQARARRDGDYVPARLIEQPPHPGKGRRP